MDPWQDSKRWADQFMPHLKQLLGWLFITEGTLPQDQQENTDLVFVILDKRFAVRVRDISERLPYNRRNEWTIRASRPSGIESELNKILNGFGDYYFYGWGDATTQKIPAFTVFDLGAVRKWLVNYVLSHKELPGQTQTNRDGSASFLAICIDMMPHDTIVYRKTTLPGDTRC